MIQNSTKDSTENYIKLQNTAHNIMRNFLRIGSQKNRNLEKISKLFFEKCKSVKERFKEWTTIMKDRNGNLVSDTKKIVENFLNDSAEQNTSYSPYEKLVYHLDIIQLNQNYTNPVWTKL